MGLESLLKLPNLIYSKLPNSLKYNRFIFDFSSKLSKRLQNFNKKSKIINTQRETLEFLFFNSKYEAIGTLRNLQLLFLELLKFVDNVCNKYDINYFISDGTLLGAVRHKGFIPWDDDIDVALLREDYNKLIEVIPNEISRFDYLKEECGLTLLKEGNKNYFKEFHSVYDVDDEDSLLNEGECLFLQLAWLKPYVKLDFFPIDFVDEDKLENFNKNYVVTKYKFYEENKKGIKKFDDEFKFLNNELGVTNDKTQYLTYAIDSANFFPPWIFDFDKIFPLSTISFEGINFNCPNDPDHYLKEMYGASYMQLPEIIETHNIIPFIESQFESNRDMDEKFKKAIDYLKEINENFE